MAAGILLVGAYVLGQQMQEPVEASARIEREATTITDTVDRTVIEETAVSRGELEPAQLFTVSAPTDSPTVITDLAIELGEIVDVGKMIVELAGRPIILLEGSFPGWRDYVRGMEAGPDVLQLQASLLDLGFYGDEVDGVYGRSTEEAIRELLTATGYPPKSGSLSVPMWTFVFVPAARVGVEAVDGQIGDRLTDTTISLASLESVVRTKIAPTLAEQLRPGLEVRLRQSDGLLVAESPISDLDVQLVEDETTVDVVFSTSDPLPDDASGDLAVEYVLQSSQSAILNVSPVAVGSESNGRVYVMKATGGPPIKVYVDVVLVTADRIGVESAELAQGDLVVLFPESLGD